MFDIGFLEILVIAVLGLLVLGPERLPEAIRTVSLWVGRFKRAYTNVRAEAIRTVSLWVGRFKRAYTNVRAEVEREIGADDIRQQLHNEQVMAELDKQKQAMDTAQQDFKDATSSINNVKDDQLK